MKILRRLFFFLLVLVLVCLLSFNVYHFVCTHLLKQELPKLFGYSFLEVVSGSMEPNIHIGDLILIDTNATDYQVGDIITFRDEYASFVTHRIVSIDEKGITTKGDANRSEDPVFPSSSVVGKLIYQFSGLGILLSSFKNPIVLFFIFFIGVLVCYLISTDKHGKPIFDEEEEELVEFLEYRDKLKKRSKKNKKKKYKIKKKFDFVDPHTLRQLDCIELPKLKPVVVTKKTKSNNNHKKKKRKAKKRSR